ncbi:MAG: hypothetical protein WC750_03920 [Patescibacteria group bacterium]|jgi:hypothetical protein
MISLEQATEQIKKANPVFGGFLDSEDTLNDYVKTQLTNYVAHPIHKARQKTYVEAIQREVARLFPKGEVNVNFNEELILDTTDHHNVLNFPATIGAHILSRFDTLLDRQGHGDFFVLDTGNVPFTEILHKRGIELGGKHINLYPKKDRNKLTSHYPMHKFEFVKSALNSEEKFTEDEMAFLKKMDELVNGIDISNCRDFSDQIVKINLALWLEMFGSDVREDVRRCVTLEHNHILRHYLPKFLLEQRDNFVWRALFDPDFRQLIMKEFTGIYGAWDYSGPKTGTHFFWGITPGGEQTPLFLDGDVLKDPSGQVEDTPLTPEGIAAALEKNIIAPSIFTKFGLVAFYLGAKVMGGPGQTEYVPKLKETWLKILRQTDPEEAKLVSLVPGDAMNTFDLAFNKTPDGKIFKQWGFDMVKNHTLSRTYLEQLKNLPLRAALKSFIPLAYYRLTAANDRQEVDCQEQDLYSGFGWVK